MRGNKYKEERTCLGAATMPHGYLNAIGLVQCLYRLLLARGPQHPHGLGKPREIRKGRPVPALRPCNPLRELCQVYCDDADYIQKVLRVTMKARRLQSSPVQEFTSASSQ